MTKLLWFLLLSNGYHLVPCLSMLNNIQRLGPIGFIPPSNRPKPSSNYYRDKDLKAKIMALSPSATILSKQSKSLEKNCQNSLLLLFYSSHHDNHSEEATYSSSEKINQTATSRTSLSTLQSQSATRTTTTTTKPTKTWADEEIEADLLQQDNEFQKYKSFIYAMASQNLGGVVDVSMDPQSKIFIRLASHPTAGSSNFVAVTGETGSGKSLLVSKVADLVTGGRATGSILPQAAASFENPLNATVEMVLQLREPHLSTTQQSMDKLGIGALLVNTTNNSADGDDNIATLHLKRTISIQPAKDPSKKKGRIQSHCQINGYPVPLKILKAIASPLVAIVDAPVAATALAQPKSRMSIIDTSISSRLLQQVQEEKLRYKACRQHREQLEQELANRILPQSIQIDREQDIELLQHWVDELDGLEARLSQFTSSLVPANDEFEGISDATSPTVIAIKKLECTSWYDNASSDPKATYSSALYERLLDVRDNFQQLDDQILAAKNAYETLASLSSLQSAKTALDRTRGYLWDAERATTPNGYGKNTFNNDNDNDNQDEEEQITKESKTRTALETSHQLLNHVEDSLAAIVRFMEDDDKGLLGVLESVKRDVCRSFSVETIDEFIAEWNMLARKHAIPASLLPSCHKSLSEELHGSVQARALLPEAIRKEEEALDDFKHICSLLTKERQKVANNLSTLITERMPLLGMGGSTFEARLIPNKHKCTDSAAYLSSTLGVDVVDFILSHGCDDDDDNDDDDNENNNINNHQSVKDREETSQDKQSTARGGPVDVVASSGEKARLLLAMECVIPGSVGSACRCATTTTTTVTTENQETMDFAPPPLAVIYDEIDAHVGGRAAVSLAEMLADQSQGSCQVVSITHSPSVAAAADRHIVIEKHTNKKLQQRQQRRLSAVSAVTVDDDQRVKELVRMASGDLALDEAEAFANALLREGASKKKKKET